MKYERFEKGGRLLAVRIAPAPSDEGFNLVTTPSDGLQVGRNVRPAGTHAPAHVHPFRGEVADGARQEVLHVLTGRVRVELFTEDGTRGDTVDVAPGETLWLTAGHAVTYLEDSEVLEIKQGPYPGPELDKKWLGSGPGGPAPTE